MMQQEREVRMLHKFPQDKLVSGPKNGLRSLRAAKKNERIVLSELHQFETLPMTGSPSVLNRLERHKALWQKFIDRYFPYLKEAKSADYLAAPMQLFMEEFQLFRKILPMLGLSLSVEQMFAGLSGDQRWVLPKMVKKRQLKAKITNPHEGKDAWFYILAAANGHEFALKALFPAASSEDLRLVIKIIIETNNAVVLSKLLSLGLSEEMKATSLLLAGEKQQLDLVELLIKQSIGEIPSFNAIMQLLKLAMKDDQRLPLLKSLFQTAIPLLEKYLGPGLFDRLLGPNYMGDLFKKAASKGQLEIVDYLQQKIGAMISMDAKVSALKVAVKKNHFHVMEFLLNEMASGLSLKMRAALLSFAVKTAEQQFFLRALLQKVEFLNAQIEQEFKKAAGLGHVAVVKCFFIEKRDALSSPTLGKALWHATLNKQPETVSFLLEQARDSIPAEFIVKALKCAANQEEPLLLLKTLLQKTAKMPTKILGELFTLMCRHGKTSVVEDYIHYVGNQITAQWKGIALIKALAHRQFAVGKLLWQTYGTEIRWQQKLQALWGGFKVDPRALVSFVSEQLFKRDLKASVISTSVPASVVTAITAAASPSEDMVAALKINQTVTFAYQQQCLKGQMDKRAASAVTEKPSATLSKRTSAPAA